MKSSAQSTHPGDQTSRPSAKAYFHVTMLFGDLVSHVLNLLLSKERREGGRKRGNEGEKDGVG